MQKNFGYGQELKNQYLLTSGSHAQSLNKS